MADSTLAVFDDDIITAVAAREGVAETALVSALAEHQRYADSLPSVDDLVYEWRRFLPYDPLVYRSPDVYCLVFQASVWAEFGTQLGFDDETLTVVRAVHTEQARRVLETTEKDAAVLDGGAPMVLGR